VSLLIEKQIRYLWAFPFKIFSYNRVIKLPQIIQGQNVMGRYKVLAATAISLLVLTVLAGCVERKLTINTKPQGALVALNDEEIGESPVTVNFNWYGDYCVRISKEGYETLNTHRKLKGPWYDHFPFDFFAQIVNPNRIVDSYEWTFELSPKQQISRDKLIQNAQELKKQLQ
jgi:hypothetical protein